MNAKPDTAFRLSTFHISLFTFHIVILIDGKENHEFSR
jgi:hypothetical protein